MNGKPPTPEAKTPKWETLAMVASFALVWAYFLAFQGARNAKTVLSSGWNIALLAAVGVLIWVLVRRLKRVLAALEEQNQRR